MNTTAQRVTRDELSELRLRHNSIFDWTENPFSVDIIGAGSIGSNLALLLARLGVEKITVWDFDEVEEHNLGHQAFRRKDIGKPKVEALAEIIEEATGIKITPKNEKVEKLECEFLILGVDSMAARKEIFENSDFDFYVDGRMGGETFNIYAGSSLEDEKYIATLYTDEEASEAPCGGRSIGYVSYMIAALMEVCVKKLMKGEECPFEQNFCAKTLIYDRSKIQETPATESNGVSQTSVVDHLLAQAESIREENERVTRSENVVDWEDDDDEDDEDE